MIARLAFFTFLVCAIHSLGAENLTPLGDAPDWSSLEKYQETMTFNEFAQRLQEIYSPREVNPNLFRIEDNAVRILMNKDAQNWFTLRFADQENKRKTITNGWRPAIVLPPARPGHELAGLKIALDPGHIGGNWAKMEERWYQVGDGKPVQEGDMTLLVAKILAPKLRKLGAAVSFVRDRLEPTTKKRPDDLKEIARHVLAKQGFSEPREDFESPADPEKEHTIRWESELLFYRNSEIRARAKRVNGEIKPDIVLCLHFNAEPWDDPRNPTLTDRNHLHLLVNGSYLTPELEFDDVRFEMVRRLLTRAFEEEFPLAEKAAAAMAARINLPPYEYTTDNVTKLGSTGYVVARNLMATRLFQCPVVYYEPYVMNSNEVFWRIQEGDYEGIRNVNGTDRPSIFREYADGVVDGLVDYYRRARGAAR